MDRIIEIKNLYAGYTNHNVLKNLSLSINEKTLTALIGPNGSGKSTLLKCLIKEINIKENQIQIYNKSINSYSNKELARYISYISQSTKQEYAFTVREIIALGRYCKDDISINNPKVDEAINLVHINNIENKKITELSGGEVQMTMLARAICQDTPIILLDEPSNNLDPKHQLELINILTKLREQNKTIICVMHDLNTVLRYFDEVILLKDGQIIKTGSTNNVITENIISNAYGIKVSISPSHDQLPSTIYYNL